jgi:hypothetical protein
VQNEGQALRGSQIIEYDLECQADRVGKQRLVLWPKLSLAADDRDRGGPQSSRRRSRARSMLRHTRATIVVNHPPGSQLHRPLPG